MPPLRRFPWDTKAQASLIANIAVILGFHRSEMFVTFAPAVTLRQEGQWISKRERRLESNELLREMNGSPA